MDSVLKNKTNIDESVVEKKAQRLGVPYIDLREEDIGENVLKELPYQTAISSQLVPFKKEGDVLFVGMLNIKDVKALETLRFVALWRKYKVKTYLISKASLDVILEKYKTLSVETSKALEKLEKELGVEAEMGKVEDIVVPTTSEKVEKIAEEAPISKMVAVILKHALEGKASDIHIEPTENDLRVRFRVDGLLHSSIVLPKKIASSIVSRIKILSNLKIDETRKPQDGRFRIKISGRKIDLRVSTFPTSTGEKVAIRILESDIGLKSLEDIGVNKTYQEILKSQLTQSFGMLLICGPTGSGKSTTLYVLLQHLNVEGVNIITLEDPVEYFVNGINQSQIKPEIGYTFAAGLRHVLRQDPDIIMVGEIRDNETAGLAVHAALTGHLLFSTVHTNNAVGVIPRLVDMGIEPFLIPASLNAIVSQRLVKKICDECKEEVEVSDEVADLIINELKGVSKEILEKEDVSLEKADFKLYRGKGCKKCADKGTKGRIGIFEILQITPELEKMIVENPSITEIEEEARKQKMITMQQDGIIKALKGFVTFEEVVRVVKE